MDLSKMDAVAIQNYSWLLHLLQHEQSERALLRLDLLLPSFFLILMISNLH